MRKSFLIKILKHSRLKRKIKKKPITDKPPFLVTLHLLTTRDSNDNFEFP